MMRVKKKAVSQTTAIRNGKTERKKEKSGTEIVQNYNEFVGSTVRLPSITSSKWIFRLVLYCKRNFHRLFVCLLVWCFACRLFLFHREHCIVIMLLWHNFIRLCHLGGSYLLLLPSTIHIVR